MDRSPHTQLPDENQTRTVVWVLRGVFLVLSVVVVSLGIVTGSTDAALGVQLTENWWVLVLAALGLFGVIVAIDLLTPTRKLSTISAVIVGSFAGLLATAMLGFVIDVFTRTYDIHETFSTTILTTKVMLGLGLCYLGITTVLQTQDDFRLVIPYVEFAKQFRGSRPLLLDTSALIDGRVLDLSETGIFQTPLIIPRFVLSELQLLSDSEDKLKRAKGRRGLEIVSRLQRSPKLDVTIDESVVAGKNVDQMLVELGRIMPAIIVSADTGLARIGAIQGVSVISLPDLANALRPSLVAGEQLKLAIVRRGEQPTQGVGYLDDGTMVVVERGEPSIGQTIGVIVTSTVQTSAGRLIFARPVEDDSLHAETESLEISRGQARESSDQAEPTEAIPSKTGASSSPTSLDDSTDGTVHAPPARPAEPLPLGSHRSPMSGHSGSGSRNPRRRG